MSRWRWPRLTSASRELYASLVEDEALRDRVFATLEAEFNLTHRMILAITGQKTLLENNPVLERSIRLRNPYVDPMSLIQVELIRRKRAAIAEGQAGFTGAEPGDFGNDQRHQRGPAQYRLMAEGSVWRPEAGRC